MARKTTENTTPKRSKKIEASTQPAVVQVASESGKEVPTNGKSANVPANLVPGNPVSSDLQDEIRRRAYELYLQRRATAGNATGDENQDWLIAEREIRSRQSNEERIKEQHKAERSNAA